MITFYKAGIPDIPKLVDSRLELLRSANNLNNDVDLAFVKEQLYQYYESQISYGNHIAYIACENGKFVGTGGVCFYVVLPTYHNPTGKKAYIINMYTSPEYRKKGVARKILELLVHDSLESGVDFISLESTKMGRHLYESFGFGPMPSEMQLKNDSYSVQ